MPPASDPAVPLCFDTSAVRGFRAATIFLARCRASWPERPLLLPAIVVAEQVRHWIVAKPTEFDGSKFASFLVNYTVAGFDDETALDAWPQVLEQLRPAPPAPWPWRYDEAPAPLTRARRQACAQVCRWPDHAIQAIALRHRALLVTEDLSLIEAMRPYEPGAVSKADIEALLLA